MWITIQLNEALVLLYEEGRDIYLFIYLFIYIFRFEYQSLGCKYSGPSSLSPREFHIANVYVVCILTFCAMIHWMLD